MPKEQTIFEKAKKYDFSALRAYVEAGNDLNICNDKGHSLFACFVDGYYDHEDKDPEELALYDLHDECDYDFWDSYVFKIQRTPLEARSSGILEELDCLFAWGVDPNLCVLVDGMTETALMHDVPTIADFKEDFEPCSPYDAGWLLNVEFVDPNE